MTTSSASKACSTMQSGSTQRLYTHTHTHTHIHTHTHTHTHKNISYRKTGMCTC